MKRMISIVAISGLMTLNALAQTSNDTPAAPSGSLPAGHPDISQMLNTPNAGGAAGSAVPAGVNLPAGHPDISQMANPSTRPAANGELSIRAVQKTAGGPQIGADPVIVDLYLQNQLLDRIETKLDDNGVATVDHIPVGLRPRAVAKVIHGGVEYASAPVQMSATAGSAEIEVPVYESTTQPPQWTVRMRHVMAERTAGGLQVMEMLSVDNPTDKAWIGETNPDGQRTTFALTLPSAAAHIQVSGPGTESARLEGTRLSQTAAVVPGTSEYRVTYFLPAIDGKADITVESPTAVQNLIMFVPEDGTMVKPDGIELMGSSDMGTGPQRFYKATDLPAGSTVSLAISGIVDPGTAVVASGDTSGAAKMIAGAGAVLILLIGVAFLFMKGAPKKA